MSALFKRKTQQTTLAQSKATEPSLLDMDDPGQGSTIPAAVPITSTVPKSGTEGKASFLNWSGNKAKPSLPLDRDMTRSQSPKSGPLSAGLTSPLNPSIASPRISTSSRTSIFERSVDSIPSDSMSGLVDPSHSQLLIDNQIPSVLDASVEAITSNEDLARVEIVTAQPSSQSETLSVPTLPNPWSEEENISTAHIPPHFSGTAKRLSFVSYADLLGVEQAEADAMGGSPRTQSPDVTHPTAAAAATTTTLVPGRPASTPVEAQARRQKSIVTMGQSADLELTRTTMADTILAPTLTFENVNPWA